MTFTELVSAAAARRIFPARRELNPVLQDLINYVASDRPFTADERRILAALMAGKFNRASGRPALSQADHERRDSLVADARAMFNELRTSGVKYHDALSTAANWAKDQPRNTEGRKAASFRKDIQCAD